MMRLIIFYLINFYSQNSMTEQKQVDSKHASIHEIISENKKKLRTVQINQLFQKPNLSEIDTSQFHHHQYMISNDIFTFFVHELQKWNKKIRNQQVTPFYHALVSRNTFIYSTLKIICLKKPNQQLTKWYSKNSYNVPQPCVLMKKYNPNQEWEIRRTFRSNTPSEINNYRRRFLCGPDTSKDSSFPEGLFGVEPEKQKCYFQSKIIKTKNYKPYKTCQDYPSLQQNMFDDNPLYENLKCKESFSAKSKNNKVRKQREAKQVKNLQNYWKKSHSRFGQKFCQDFSKGNFNHNKQFRQMSSIIQPRNIQTAGLKNRFFEQNENLIYQIKKDRLKTSLGVRKNFAHQQRQSTGNENFSFKAQNIQETKQNSGKWIDNFIVDEDKINLRDTPFGSLNAGMSLMSNPFDLGKGKIKKKRK